jgi:hypothetical protein
MSPGPSSRGEPPETTKVKSPPGGPSALSSNEVNFLVYRYLLESGFGHAAFAFGCESDVDRIEIEGKDVPVGALVSFIQKGFQMMEIEANLNASGSDVYGKYVQFSANDILTKDLDELRSIAKEMQQEDSLGDAEAEEGNGTGTGTTIDTQERHLNDGRSVLPPLDVKAGEENEDGMDVDQPEVHEMMKEEDVAVFEEEEEKKKNEQTLTNGSLHQNEGEIPAKIEEPLPPSPPRVVD